MPLKPCVKLAHGIRLKILTLVVDDLVSMSLAEFAASDDRAFVISEWQQDLRHVVAEDFGVLVASDLDNRSVGVLAISRALLIVRCFLANPNSFVEPLWLTSASHRRCGNNL
ncbi:MAG: hypothetical protein R3C12_18705 [Planctomycetaceae bacterium]